MEVDGTWSGAYSGSNQSGCRSPMQWGSMEEFVAREPRGTMLGVGHADS